MIGVLHVLHWHYTHCQFDIAIPCQILVGGLCQHQSGIDIHWCRINVIGAWYTDHVALFKYQLWKLPPAPPQPAYTMICDVILQYSFLPLSLIRKYVWLSAPQYLHPAKRVGQVLEYGLGLLRHSHSDALNASAFVWENCELYKTSGLVKTYCLKYSEGRKNGKRK